MARYIFCVVLVQGSVPGPDVHPQMTVVTLHLFFGPEVQATCINAALSLTEAWNEQPQHKIFSLFPLCKLLLLHTYN